MYYYCIFNVALLTILKLEIKIIGLKIRYHVGTPVKIFLDFEKYINLTVVFCTTHPSPPTEYLTRISKRDLETKRRSNLRNSKLLLWLSRVH